MKEGWGEEKVGVGGKQEAWLEEGWRGKGGDCGGEYERKNLIEKGNLTGKKGGEDVNVGLGLLHQSDQDSPVPQSRPCKICKVSKCSFVS